MTFHPKYVSMHLLRTFSYKAEIPSHVTKFCNFLISSYILSLFKLAHFTSFKASLSKPGSIIHLVVVPLNLFHSRVVLFNPSQN